MNEIGIPFTPQMIRALENTRADGTAIDPHLPIKTMTRRTHKRLRRKGPRMRSAGGTLELPDGQRAEFPAPQNMKQLPSGTTANASNARRGVKRNVARR